MGLIRRYLTGFRGVDTDAPGLFEKDDGTSWYRKPDGSEAEIGSGGGQPDLAIVEIALLNGWDGSALPFDVVRTDTQGLWDATNHQFVAKTTGWYAVQTFTTQASGGGVTDTGNPGAGSVFASVGGPGDNIGAGNSYALTTEAVFPMISGITHLRAGDTIDIEGVPNGEFAVSAYAFAIQLIST